MSALPEIPDLPLVEDVHWRHALVYQRPTADDAYAAGQFAQRLRHVLHRVTDPGGRPSSPVPHQIQQAYERGVAVGRQEACPCTRCVEYSDEQLRSLQHRQVTVGSLTLLTDGRIEPLDSERRVFPGEHRLLVAMLQAYPSYAGWSTLQSVGRALQRDEDKHLVRVQVARLRPRLEPYGLVIETESGLGYRLVVQEGAVLSRDEETA